MEFSELRGKIPNEMLESLSSRGFSKMTPPQESAVRLGLLAGKSLVVASPTASGKTLVAEIACVNSIMARGRKAVYIAPMRALVMEKFEEFREAYPYIKSAVSIGDLDSNDPWLADYQMVFVSTEKFDSLMRHGINWLPSIGCVVFDEVHMLDDASRGPTLELLITKVATTLSAQVIALSATIGNADELASWLGAGIVKSDYRSVRLVKGIVYDGSIYYPEGRGYETARLGGVGGTPEVSVVEDTLARSKQALVFYSTKRNAEAGAARFARVVRPALTENARVELDGIADTVLNVLSRPTEQCKRLSELVRNGVAFHHAGLLNEQRTAVERAFKSNLIKVVCATTTLGYGVNMPAHTVLVRDIHRFGDDSHGTLSVNEVLQLFGRAGRPSYDKEGRALLIANNRGHVDALRERYIDAEPEPLESKLGMAPVLRSHLLAFIAEDFLNDRKAIEGFIAKSFYGFSMGRSRRIRQTIEEMLDELAEWGFIEADGGFTNRSYRATKIGERVSRLYIDPLSAKWIIDSLESVGETMDILFMLSNTIEMRPHARATKDAELEFAAYNRAKPEVRLGGVYEQAGVYHDPVRAFGTALMLYDWMDEAQEHDIVKEYGTTPGALHSKLMNADWLAYAAIELARVQHMPLHKLIDARVRLRYGIKEELLDLVRLREIGRVRARLLFDNGIKSVAEVRANHDRVRAVLGKEIAEKVFAQL